MNKFGVVAFGLYGAVVVFVLGMMTAGFDRMTYKVTPQHNRYEVGISCNNNGDPTVVGNFDGMLVVSCGL